VKKQMAILGLAVILSGCEDAGNALIKAQEAANQAITGVQDKVSALGVEDFNIGQLGSSAEQANTLFQSVQRALNVDLNDPQAVAEVEGHIAMAYGCLVSNSSSFLADQLVNKLLSTVNNQDVLNLIERGVEKGAAAGSCVV
jgi:hypothetical protein